MVQIRRAVVIFARKGESISLQERVEQKMSGSSPMEYILFECKGDYIINVSMGGANLYFMSFVLAEDEKEQSKDNKSFVDWLYGL